MLLPAAVPGVPVVLFRRIGPHSGVRDSRVHLIQSSAETDAQYAASSNASGLPVFALAGQHPIRAQEAARSITVRPIDLP